MRHTRHSLRLVELLGDYGRARLGDDWWPENADAWIGAPRAAELRGLLPETEVLPEPGQSWVFDPCEGRAWGPFADNDDANRFVESDKYLDSWCVVHDGGNVLLDVVARYAPADYHGTWPR